MGAARRPRGWWLWAIVGGFVVIGAGGGLIGAAVASSGSSPATAAAACSVTPVADRVLPSVVTIAVTGPPNTSSADDGSGGGSRTAGSGSGEVIRSDGYILTNNHVIAAAAGGGSVQVLFADGTASPATIVGRDPLTDLAVLRVSGVRNLTPITLGSSASVRVGEPVIAAGAPLGLSGTVTSGIVSALDRTVEVPGEADASALLVSAVQTDAAINPGNSGGALVNCAGDLVGVPTAGATVPDSSGGTSAGSIGLGFAIPVDIARTISDEIIATGRATHAFFGLRTVPIPASAGDAAGQAETAHAGVTRGLFVAGVVSGGPAERAGLREGDVITSVDGQAATSNAQLQELTLTRRPGDRVGIGYSRDGRDRTATVTLTAQP